MGSNPIDATMKAYLFDTGPNGKVYLMFGEDCVEAAKALQKKVGGDWEKYSVGGTWDINPDEPIVLSKLWPYFTSNPPNRHWS